MANGQFYSSLKEELGLGKGYIYCSKNAINDDLALAHFGKSIAWVSGGNYVVGDRRTTSGVQYKCIQNATGRTTAQASDTAYWEFDLENFQPYNTGKTYNIGHKTTINNLHYVCAVNGTTGTFNAENWTQVPISNYGAPFRLMNTAILFLNADSRFVSYELLNTVLNKAYHNIHLLASNGVWNEGLTTPVKYTKIIGQSKWKTKIDFYNTFGSGGYTMPSTYFFNKVSVILSNYASGSFKFDNCYINYIHIRSNGSGVYFNFMYKTIIDTLADFTGGGGGYLYLIHLVNCTFISFNSTLIYASGNTYIIKNNIFKTGSNFGNLALVNAGNFDNNAFSTAAILSALKTSYPLQNVNSVGGATYIATNADYTLASNSPCIGIGANGNNIGAEGVGYSKTNADIFNSDLGATYKNVKKLSTAIVRDQIGKQIVSATSNTVVLDASASAIDDTYNGFRFYISTGLGAGEIHTISDYDGASKTATISDNFTVTPDATSYYEILDGSIISAIGDLGSVQIVGKLNSNTVNYFDVSTSTILTQNVSSEDCRNIGSTLTYQLKTGLLADLSDGVTRTFKQDEALITDANGYGCGDALFNPATIAASTLSFRYYQITIGFHK